MDILILAIWFLSIALICVLLVLGYVLHDRAVQARRMRTLNQRLSALYPSGDNDG